MLQSKKTELNVVKHICSGQSKKQRAVLVTEAKKLEGFFSFVRLTYFMVAQVCQPVITSSMNL